MRLTYYGLLAAFHLLVFASWSRGAGAEPTFTVTNKVPPAFQVVNRIPPVVAAPPAGRWVTEVWEGYGVVTVWRETTTTTIPVPAVAPVRPFPAGSGSTEGTIAHPAAVPSSSLPATTGTVRTATVAVPAAPFGNTDPFCAPGGG